MTEKTRIYAWCLGTMTEKTRIYAWCLAGGHYCWRDPGRLYADGDHDTDENPVWLWADDDDMRAHHVDMDRVPDLPSCGC